jgi:transcription initiation factor TFIID subunit 2
MDLGTVNQKLKDGRYENVEDVFDDIQLIWDNCKTYNPPNSWIHNTAEKLERSFKKMAKNYLPSISIIVPGSITLLI